MSNLGSLSRCMMESDPESRTRAKWLRGKSLALSLGIEAAVLAALLIAPLLAPGILPPLFMVTPAPPYRGDIRAMHHSSPDVARHAASLIFQPSAERPSMRRATDHFGEAPPTIGDWVGPGGRLPGIPGGEGNGTAINLALPQAAAPAKPLRQSEGVMAARLIRRVQPEYPRIAWLMRLAGTVRLRAIIGTDGSVQQLEVLGGNPILARAAVEAVRQWCYEPTRLDGQPVEVETNITVTFVLN
jgi:protein TonB